MKLILTAAVDKLGLAGDVVEVKDGYGRNYLMPRGFAVGWTRGAEKQVATIRKARQTREIKTQDEAQQVRASLESRTVRLSVRAGANGRLFGAVTPADVADGIKAAGGPQVDRRKVELPQAIKSVGDYTVHVRLHADVRAAVTVSVVPD